jgi:hypothetical protein
MTTGHGGKRARSSYAATTAYAAFAIYLALTRLATSRRLRTAAQTTRATFARNTAHATLALGEADMKQSVQAEPDVHSDECGNCGHVAWGFSAHELSKEGWETHHFPGGKFILCGDCAKAFAERRSLAKATA